ncbi:retinoblastoma-like protein 2 isoform X2 [Symsagittifera roscoffensis]|uniref:retinoblastoma-like protein 2 isoform X2 n=1 Tax=Symsagittifera roscoffensis TaxID=84072 RepID=UPI00307BBEFE
MEIGNSVSLETFYDSYGNELLSLGLNYAFVECCYLRYDEIGHNFDLQGNDLVWIVCSLYEQYRESRECGNIGLDKFLVVFAISFSQLFNTMNSWMQMAGSTSSFKEHMGLLELTFNVDMVVFKNYERLFSTLFCEMEFPNLSGHHIKRFELTREELFYFIWLLHIQIKVSLNGLRGDLVNCSQLLLCCVDFVYMNIMNSENRHLISPSFVGSSLKSETIKSNDLGFGSNQAAVTNSEFFEAICCRRGGGHLRECFSVRQHWFRPYLEKMAAEGALTLDDGNLMSMFSCSENYFSNRNYLETSYELLIQKSGQLDERLFVKEAIKRDLNLSSLVKPSILLAGPRDRTRRNPQQSQGSTEVCSNLEGVSKLQAILVGFSNMPLMDLIQICNECSAITLQEIEDRINQLGYQFANQQCQQTTGSNLVNLQLYFSETLYYKLLHTMVLSETKRIKCSSSPSKLFIFDLLHRENFHKSLFACCIEIVLTSYGSKNLFPWILEVFTLKPYHFYRVIEVVIKHEEGLSRDVIKHLNWVEESILEEHVWQSDSPLWIDIEQAAGELPSGFTGVPRCIDVLLPNQMSNSTSAALKNRVQNKLQGSESVRAANTMKLVTSSGQTLISLPSTSTNSLGTSKLIDQLNQNQLTMNPLNATSSQLSGVSPTKMTLDKPRKTGALSLFFRKVYLLASVRIRQLMAGLEATDPQSANQSSDSQSSTSSSSSAAVNEESNELKKIWAVFENCMVLSSELLVNRHLDQVILATVYLVGKALSKKWTFEKILGVYRFQQQANRRTYRRVLIAYLQTADGTFEENRDDIAVFYDQIFVPNCTDYVEQFLSKHSYSATKPHAASGLIPNKTCLDKNTCVIPCHKGKPLAARKVCLDHNFYLMPHRDEDDKSAYQKSNTLTYRFSICPSKKLDEFNSYIQSKEMSKKLNPTASASSFKSKYLQSPHTSKGHLFGLNEKVNYFKRSMSSSYQHIGSSSKDARLSSSVLPNSFENRQT